MDSQACLSIQKPAAELPPDLEKNMREICEAIVESDQRIDGQVFGRHHGIRQRRADHADARLIESSNRQRLARNVIKGRPYRRIRNTKSRISQ